MTSLSVAVLVLVLVAVAFESTSGRGARRTRDADDCFAQMGPAYNNLTDFGAVFSGGVGKPELKTLCPYVSDLVDCLGSPDLVAFVAYACASEQSMQDYLDFEDCVTAKAVPFVAQVINCVYYKGRQFADQPTNECTLYGHRSSCSYDAINEFCGEGPAIYGVLWYNQTAADEGLDCRFTVDSE